MRGRLHLQNQISELKLKQIEAAKAKSDKNPSNQQSSSVSSKVVGGVKHKVVTKNMLQVKRGIRKVKLEFSPLTYNPIGPRLDHTR